MSKSITLLFEMGCGRLIPQFVIVSVLTVLGEYLTTFARLKMISDRFLTHEIQGR